MNRLPLSLMTIVLLSLLLIGCGQRDEAGDRTAADGTEIGENAMQSEVRATTPISTAQDNPGQDDAAAVLSRSLLDNATTNRELTTFTELLRSANLVKNLSGTGPYTVFAPAEGAFRALPDTTLTNLMKPENQERLQAIMNNHIIAGKLTTNDLQDGSILKTSAGQQLKVSKRNGQVRINGALVEEPDGMSSNGVLHTINKVLIPAEETQ